VGFKRYFPIIKLFLPDTNMQIILFVLPFSFQNKTFFLEKSCLVDGMLNFAIFVPAILLPAQLNEIDRK